MAFLTTIPKKELILFFVLISLAAFSFGDLLGLNSCAQFTQITSDPSQDLKNTGFGIVFLGAVVVLLRLSLHSLEKGEGEEEEEEEEDYKIELVSPSLYKNLKTKTKGFQYLSLHSQSGGRIPNLLCTCMLDIPKSYASVHVAEEFYKDDREEVVGSIFRDDTKKGPTSLSRKEAIPTIQQAVCTTVLEGERDVKVKSLKPAEATKAVCTTVLQGKRHVIVNSLKLAEAAKRCQKEKEDERKMKKEAFKLKIAARKNQKGRKMEELNKKKEWKKRTPREWRI